MNPKNNTPQKAPAFTTREEKLLSTLKIPLDELKARRMAFLTRGVHWEMVNKHAWLSQEGAARLVETLALPVPSTEKKTPRVPRALLGPVPFTGVLKVHRVPMHNPRIVVCYLPGTDPEDPLSLISLRVRENRNFVLGMEVKNVRKVEESVFDLVGNPPRSKGRW